MPHKRYRIQPALTECLRRLGKTRREHAEVLTKSVPALATMLLDTMIERRGFLPKERYYGAKFEVNGLSYSDWIVRLKKAEILESYSDEKSDKASWIRFRAGPVLARYLNQQQSLLEQLATKRDVDELELRMDTRLNELDAKIQMLQTEVTKLTAPPPDAMRQQLAHELSQEIQVLSEERVQLIRKEVQPPLFNQS